ncbi:MAG: hypothetical protein ACI35O_09835 [Bacillaceae bacterium]
MKKLFTLFIIGSTLLLSGCLYPEERLAQNTTPYNDQIETVQKAVDQFKQDNGGILPIQTKDNNTLEYHKYPIDFKKIVPRYISDIPGNAYESGGIFQYVLVNVEKDPKVKLLDLRTADKVQNMQLRVKMYRDKNKYPPFKDVIADGVYSIDYKKLNIKEKPTVVSPFTNNNLPFVIDANGDVYVDYTKDLEVALQNNKNINTNKDIRPLLVDNSMFVPAYSLPYQVVENRPIFFVQ